MLDDATYRRERKIRVVRARVYDRKGEVIEELVTSYDARGSCVKTEKLVLDGLELRTLAQAKKAMSKLLRGHQEAPPSFRRALVAFTRQEMAKGRPIVAVARDLGMPSPSLTRWVLNLRPAHERKKAAQSSAHEAPRGRRHRETCAICLAMERGEI
jgi:transposase-like protein